MMARLIAMSILPNHTGAENRQILLPGRDIRKHTIELLCKAVFSSDQSYQSANILRHRP